MKHSVVNQLRTHISDIFDLYKSDDNRRTVDRFSLSLNR